MHVVFCHDTFYSTKRDGTVLSYGAFPYSFWERRFLPHFDEITVIGRKKKLSSHETGVLEISSGKNVQHVLLPNIHEPVKRLTKFSRMYKRIKEQVELADAVIIRGPVEYGLMAAKAARECGKPYAIEMMGCTYDANFARDDMLHKLYAPVRHKKTKEMVRLADAVMYTTAHALQERYPTLGNSEHASNVEIAQSGDSVLTTRLAKIENPESDDFTIGLIGHFVSGMRGVDVAIKALGIVHQKQVSDPTIRSFKFKILGQGIPAQWFGLIKENGLEDKVEFCGTIPRGNDVLNWLDGIDLYLQPGLHEGLPRSLIEAMSRGCPSLASDSGASAEVLDAAFIHPYGDAEKLSQQIISLMERAEERKAASENFEKAKGYAREVLVPRRAKFWADFAKSVQKQNDPLKDAA